MYTTLKYIHDNNNTEYVIELYKDGSRADYLENNKVEAIQKLCRLYGLLVRKAESNSYLPKIYAAFFQNTFTN